MLNIIKYLSLNIIIYTLGFGSQILKVHRLKKKQKVELSWDLQLHFNTHKKLTNLNLITILITT